MLTFEPFHICIHGLYLVSSTLAEKRLVNEIKTRAPPRRALSSRITVPYATKHCEEREGCTTRGGETRRPSVRAASVPRVVQAYYSRWSNNSSTEEEDHPISSTHPRSLRIKIRRLLELTHIRRILVQRNISGVDFCSLCNCRQTKVFWFVMYKLFETVHFLILCIIIF